MQLNQISLAKTNSSMKQKYFRRTESSRTPSSVPEAQPTYAGVSNVVGRRSFLKGLGVVGATLLLAGALLVAQVKANAQSGRRLSKGDADLLRFAAWAEIVESDLWTQYNELGGATKPNDGPPNAGNPPYIAALQNLDGDMPQYISDNTDDELSHAAFLNAYLRTHGAEEFNLDRFRKLRGSEATGVDPSKIGKRLTNLRQLSVDLNWYTQYRSEENPDLGAIWKGPFKILNEPAIPLDDTDTPPNIMVPSPPIPAAAQRIQAIANT